MVISTKTRYGMRFLAELSRFYGIKTVALREVSEKHSLSLKYLSQIVIPLKSRGLIVATRGTSGGYSLTKPPAEINLKEVVETLQGGLDLVECVADEQECRKSEKCPTQWVWRGLSDAIGEYLEKLTLEDIKNRLNDQQQIDYSI